MSPSKHTPGPWAVETVRTSCGVCHKVGPWPHEWRSGKTTSACIYDDYPSPPEGTDTMLANARLIAAAPDLLEALKDTLGTLRSASRALTDANKLVLGGKQWGERDIARIEAVIAKAEGQP